MLSGISFVSFVVILSVLIIVMVRKRASLLDRERLDHELSEDFKQEFNSLDNENPDYSELVEWTEAQDN